MNAIRHFGTVVHITAAGGAVVERDDGLGRIYLPSKEAPSHDTVAIGDRLIFSVLPGGEGYAAVLDL
jgi:hypothetical protein